MSPPRDPAHRATAIRAQWGAASAALRCALTLAAFPLFAAGPATAQDFDSPARAGPGSDAATFIERALPPPRGAAALETVRISWSAVPDLVTSAVALGGGWRAFRAAAGLSQTGSPELGWNALALALGSSRHAGGAALRLEARRDRQAPLPAAPGRGVGLEAGAGAWVVAGRSVVLWASAPQIWRQGSAPPLPRALEIGARLEGRDAAVWIARGAPPLGRGENGDHLAGLSCRAGRLIVWLEARDRPLRGRLGLSAALRHFRVAAAVEGHPVLGETARLSLGLGEAPRGAP